MASIALTLGAMFVIGALRALIANVRWWKAGVEVLSLGAIAALLAYASGALVACLRGKRLKVVFSQTAFAPRAATPVAK